MNTEANRIIDDIGGTSAVADLCDVTTGAVSQWRENGIPKARLMFIRLARPDVFVVDQTVRDTSEKVA
jgi:hypothetical protein